MKDNDKPAIMGVCVRDIFPSVLPFGQECCHWATTGRQALNTLRFWQMDLMLTSLKIPDMTMWELIGKIRNAWPDQKWALVCEDLTKREEVHARTLGVSRIFCETIDFADVCKLAVSLRRRTIPAMVTVQTSGPGQKAEQEQIELHRV